MEIPSAQAQETHSSLSILAATCSKVAESKGREKSNHTNQPHGVELQNIQQNDTSTKGETVVVCGDKVAVAAMSSLSGSGSGSGAVLKPVRTISYQQWQTVQVPVRGADGDSHLQSVTVPITVQVPVLQAFTSPTPEKGIQQAGKKRIAKRRQPKAGGADAGSDVKSTEPRVSVAISASQAAELLRSGSLMLTRSQLPADLTATCSGTGSGDGSGPSGEDTSGMLREITEAVLGVQPGDASQPHSDSTSGSDAEEDIPHNSSRVSKRRGSRNSKAAAAAAVGDGCHSPSNPPRRREELKRRLCDCVNCTPRADGTTLNQLAPLKQHVCGECGRVYGKTSHLRAHQRSHTGARPYACNWLLCQRSFTRSDELYRHKRIHTGDKRFACDACGKRFSRSDHLHKHARTHSPATTRRRPAPPAAPLRSQQQHQQRSRF